MPTPRTVVLVEGVSDQRAVARLAWRRGRDLDAEGVSILAMGGSKNVYSHIKRFGPSGLDLKIAGLCDSGEERDFQRALERAHLGSDLTRQDMERLGFFVCDADLEDELIRALGTEMVEQVVSAMGDSDHFRSFQKQPVWRGRSVEHQLRRFLGTHSGRKIESAPLLVDALDLNRVPRPLDLLLAFLGTVDFKGGPA